MKTMWPSESPLRSRSQGFTLLEVMVALAIIAIVLVSVLRMQGQTISMNEAFRFYTIAPELATAKMADIRQDPESAELNSSGDFDEAFAGYSWQAAVEEVVIETEEDREMKLNRVDVTVSYMDEAYIYVIREYMPAESNAL
jgi:general secretion pathway protein I